MDGFALWQFPKCPEIGMIQCAEQCAIPFPQVEKNDEKAVIQNPCSPKQNAKIIYTVSTQAKIRLFL
jgi:hypothetical protein